MQSVVADSAWRELLDEFRALGGTAENVRLGQGSRGRGLFAEDPSRPVRLRAPDNLLLPREFATFRDGRFRVAAEANFGARESAWIERYENEFSWAAGGRDEPAEFLESAHALPGEVLQKVAAAFEMPFLTRDLTEELIQERFLSSRVISYRNREVVMPIIDLINHGPARGYDCSDGVGVQGVFADEVLVLYTHEDTFGVFRTFGFPAECPWALSLPLTVPTGFGPLSVAREAEEGELIELPGPQQPMRFRVPKVVKEDGEVKLSFLLLGQVNFPRIPRSLYVHAMRGAGLPTADEPFELIQHHNRHYFLEILKDIEALDGAFVRTARAVCRLQLESLSRYFGVRPI